MEISELIKKYSENKWLTICRSNNIDCWDLVDYLGSKVYITKPYAGKIEIKSRACLLCGKKGTVCREKGFFVLQLLCDCGKDGTSVVSIEKIKRFLPEEEAINLYSEINRKKCRGLKTTTEYWMSNGYTLEQAILEAKKEHARRTAIRPSRKGIKDGSVRCVEYWIKRGYTEEEAREEIKNRQTQNGIVWYQQKYGEEQGEILYHERIDRWLETYYSREDIAEINSRKSFTKEKKIEKYGLREYLIRNKGRMQKQMITRIALGQWTSPELLVDRDLYYSKVKYFTAQSLTYFYDNVNPENLKISYNDNHVDHIFSRHHGFMFSIPPEIIGSYINLRVISAKENHSKGPRSDYTVEQLQELYETVDENWHLIVSNAIV